MKIYDTWNIIQEAQRLEIKPTELAINLYMQGEQLNMFTQDWVESYLADGEVE